MSELVVIGFGDEKKAFEMRAVLQKLQKENHIDMEDVVVVTKGDKGKLRIHKSDSFTTAADVVRTYLETLLGIMFVYPLFAGYEGSDAAGSSRKLSKVGIDEKFMKELDETLTPASSALFVLVRKDTPDKVLEAIKGFKGKVLKTSLTTDEEDELRKVMEQD